MWGKKSKLQEWVDAGLISGDQAVAIQNHITEHKSGRFDRGLLGLGVLAIVIGILAIVASNWYVIPGSIKIAAHVLLNLLVAGFVWHGIKTEKPMFREMGALAFFGLTLSFIALIGQVFHLDGTIAGALVLWMLIITPFMFIVGQSYMTAVPWMIGFLVTIQAALFEYVGELPRELRIYFFVGAGTLLPLALMALSSFGLVQEWKYLWSRVFLKTGLILSALSASIFIGFSGLFYYHRGLFNSAYAHRRVVVEPEVNYLLVIFLIGAVGIACHCLYNLFYRDNGLMRTVAVFAAVGFAVSILPAIFGFANYSLLMALLFIAYWIMIGAFAQHLGFMRLVSLSILVIAVRIFIIYLEVFGSLMDTGIGLIVGGTVVIALIAAMRRINRILRAKAKV